MPQIFEFQFNPPKQSKAIQEKNDLIFDSFCFEPQNIYERRVGSLYAVGFLENTLPQNTRFLEVLSQKIKENYYKFASDDPEKSLKESLRAANEHLERIAKSGDVSWLGNLSFAVFSLKDFQLNFTKVGQLKVLLMRKGQIIDIDQKLKFEDIEPYPLKIFGNLVSVKLAENDIILVLNQEVFDLFFNENLLTQIADKTLTDLSLEELKTLKNILNGKKEKLTKIFGICLLLVLSKETAQKERQTLEQEKTLKIFSFKEFFQPFAKTIKDFGKRIRLGQNKNQEKSKGFFKLRLKNPFRLLKFSSEKIKAPKAIILAPRTPKINFPKAKGFSLASIFNKKIILVLILIFFLLLGFFLFEKKEERKIKNYQLQLNQIQEKIDQAESYFASAEHSLQAKKNAGLLYKEAWDEILPLINISSSLPPVIARQTFELKSVVLERLYQLNNLTEISEPDLFFEFKAREFIPQRLISFKGSIYFFSPHSENIFIINQQAEGEILKTSKKFNSAALLENSIIFFSKPNQITIFKNGGFRETISLEQFSPDSDFASFNSYLLHLYFLETKSNSIVRYPFLSELEWRAPQPWLSPETKTAKDFKSMAIDSSIWLLTKENTIERYYLGQFEESINLKIFPEPKSLSKIFTSPAHSYLYLLEPIERRIVILDKKGGIVSQYQSKKFDNLLDFSVSQDGKTIWLLNGLKVYKIDL